MDGSVHTSPLRKISSKALKKISENELKITLFSTVSLLALTGCGGGGGGGYLRLLALEEAVVLEALSWWNVA